MEGIQISPARLPLLYQSLILENLLISLASVSAHSGDSRTISNHFRIAGKSLNLVRQLQSTKISFLIQK
jgi:hypothetical protein